MHREIRISCHGVYLKKKDVGSGGSVHGVARLRGRHVEVCGIAFMTVMFKRKNWKHLNPEDFSLSGLQAVTHPPSSLNTAVGALQIRSSGRIFGTYFP